MKNTTTGKKKGEAEALVALEKLKKGSERVRKAQTNPAPIGPAYASLIERLPLRPISNKEHHNAALRLQAELMERSNENNLTVDERDYYRVLNLLIRDYEKNIYPREKLPACEMLAFLMEQHDLRQVDLVNELGSQTSVSFILSGRRQPTREQIEALSKRFNVSPAVFFGP